MEKGDENRAKSMINRLFCYIAYVFGKLCLS